MLERELCTADHNTLYSLQRGIIKSNSACVVATTWHECTTQFVIHCTVEFPHPKTHPQFQGSYVDSCCHCIQGLLPRCKFYSHRVLPLSANVNGKYYCYHLQILLSPIKKCAASYRPLILMYILINRAVCI